MKNDRNEAVVYRLLHVLHLKYLLSTSQHSCSKSVMCVCVCVCVCVFERGGGVTCAAYHILNCLFLRKNKLGVNDCVVLCGRHVPDNLTCPLTVSVVFISLNRVAVLR